MTEFTFRELVIEQLLNIVPNGVTVKGETVEGNNGFKQESIVFEHAMYDIKPCVFTDKIFMDYQCGKSIETISQDVLSYVLSELQSTGTILKTASELATDIENVRNYISFRLVNAALNAELLKKIPHKLYLDLAIIYVITLPTDLIDNKKTASMEINEAYSMIINNDIMVSWNCEIDYLHEIALHNMNFQSCKISRVYVDENGNKGMYLISNENECYGAATILCPSVLRRFCKSLGNRTKQLIIIPASVHYQLLVLPSDVQMNASDLRKIVRDMNSSLPKNEVLSDNVYLYDVDFDSVVVY